MLHAAAAAKSLQLCLTLCDPIDGSPPGSPISGILQARTLEWVAISFSNAWKWKVKVKSLSRVWPSATPWTAVYQAPPSMGFSRQEYWRGVPLLHSLVQKQFNWHLRTLGERMQGTEGQTQWWVHLNTCTEDVLSGSRICCSGLRAAWPHSVWWPAQGTALALMWLQLSFTEHHHESFSAATPQGHLSSPRNLGNHNSCVSCFDAKTANTTCFWTEWKARPTVYIIQS